MAYVIEISAFNQPMLGHHVNILMCEHDADYLLKWKIDTSCQYDEFHIRDICRLAFTDDELAMVVRMKLDRLPIPVTIEITKKEL